MTKKQYVLALLILVIAAYVLVPVSFSLVDLLKNNSRKFIPTKPLEISIMLRYKITPEDGLTVQCIGNLPITSYNNVPEQTDSTPNYTATSRMVKEGMVAVSQDLWKKKVHPGDILYIRKLNKYYIVDDTMHSKWKNRIDVFVYDKKQNFSLTSDVYVIRVAD